MKLVFTGSGSFTGYWILKELVFNGFDVIPLFEENESKTVGIRKIRVLELSKLTRCYFNINYGSKIFFDFLSSLNKIDIFSHHFFYTKDYKSKEYDVLESLDISVGNINLLFKKLKKLGCKFFVLTGSSFEGNEGKGDKELKPFSPYGLAKSLSSDIFKYYCSNYGIKFCKFVIPNPFGPYEEYKFTSYLADNWLNNQVAIIKTPDYVRDNIPVDLLAKSYSYFLKKIKDNNFYKLNPSGYVETNLNFVKRFKKEFKKRLNLKCDYKVEKDLNLTEPLKRYNNDNMFKIIKGYDENVFWEDLINFYKNCYGYNFLK